MGFTVLRFDDDEVLNDIENVERVLLGLVEDFEKAHPLTARKPAHSTASGRYRDANLTQGNR